MIKAEKNTVPGESCDTKSASEIGEKLPDIKCRELAIYLIFNLWDHRFLTPNGFG